MSDTTQYPDGPYLITWRNGDVDSIFDIRRGMAYGREGGYSTDWLLEQGGTLTPLVPSTELDAARQRIADLEAEVERLRNAPPMPQPDWRDCPGYATHHAFRLNGKGYWVRLPEQKYASLRRPVTAEDVDWWDEECDESGLTLPLGIDWRQTLRQRPQEPQP